MKTKRKVAAVLAIIILIHILPVSIYAEIKGGELNNVTEDEDLFLRAQLVERGYGEEEYISSVLYDTTDYQRYIMGATNKGYAIFERSPHEFCECGEGNPFGKNTNIKKYYGGPLCYYTKDGTQFYNIMKQEYTDSMISVQRRTGNVDLMKKSEGVQSLELFNVDLPNNLTYIKRAAFGYNDDNTCSAVATCIALNYIARRHNMYLIKKTNLPESLDNGNPTSSQAHLQMYPQAHEFHRQMVQTYGMGPVSFGSGITDPVATYSASEICDLLDYNDLFNYELELDSHFISTVSILPMDEIKEEIEAEKPVLITIIAGEAGYNAHTMCLYGARIMMVDNNYSREVLVHTGWHSNNLPYSNGTSFFQNAIWISAGYTGWYYTFDFENPLESFEDIPNFTNWAYRGILYAVKNEIMNGTSQTTFSPSSDVNRAMIVTLVYRLAGSPNVSGSVPFTDVPSGKYYTKPVIWAYQNNIIEGTSATTFSPYNSITREAIITVLYRYAKNYQHYNTSYTNDTTVYTAYSDFNQVHPFAQEAIKWALTHGILTGQYNQTTGNTYINPLGYVSRAEVATILMRFCEHYSLY